jgi:hypothetical protein
LVTHFAPLVTHFAVEEQDEMIVVSLIKINFYRSTSSNMVFKIFKEIADFSVSRPELIFVFERMA